MIDLYFENTVKLCSDIRIFTLDIMGHNENMAFSKDAILLVNFLCEQRAFGAESLAATTDVFSKTCGGHIHSEHISALAGYNIIRSGPGQDDGQIKISVDPRFFDAVDMGVWPEKLVRYYANKGEDARIGQPATRLK